MRVLKLTSPSKTDLTVQRKHFMLTLWPQREELPAGAIIEQIELDLKSLPDLKYSTGQLELSCQNKNPHIQLFLELYKKKRGRTVMNHFNGDFWKTNPHTEWCISPNASRNYCMKDICDKCLEGAPNCARVEHTQPFTHGVWEPPVKKANKKLTEIKSCSDLIKEGRSPEYIAWHYPHLFLKYGNKITSTIHYRELYKQRQEFLTEENDYEQE